MVCMCVVLSTYAYLWHPQFWHQWSQTTSVSRTLAATTSRVVRRPVRRHVSAVCTAQRNEPVSSDHFTRISVNNHI